MCVARWFSLLMVLVLAGLLLAPAVLATSPNPSPFRWPAPAGQPVAPLVRIDPALDQPPPVGVGPGAVALIEKAVEEWCHHDQPDVYPSSGKGGNPTNTGREAVMDEHTPEGVRVMLAQRGRARSFTDAERQAISDKYPSGFCPRVWKEGDPAPQVEVKPWTGQELINHPRPPDTGGLEAGEGVAVQVGNERLLFKRKSKVLFSPIPFYDSEGNPRPVQWFLTSDTNGDGKITNADADPPLPAGGMFWVDFYSTAKHELGHAFSLLHSHTGVPGEGQGAPLGLEGAASTSSTPGEVYVVTQADLDAALPDVRSADANSGGMVPRLHVFSQDRVKGFLVFASDRPGGHGGYDLYYALWDGVKWGPPVNLGPDFNTEHDEVDPFLVPGGSELYFSSNRDGGGFDLYSSLRSDVDAGLFDGWSPSEPLPLVNSIADDRAPVLSPDHRTLWFASDRAGGEGGFDLWRSALDAGDWQPPVNPGLPLNTPANERDPFLAADGLLYFASDRPGGEGGYDLWHWFPLVPAVAPLNLGAPLNTASDELLPRFSSDGSRLYFTSDRDAALGTEVFFADRWLPQVYAYGSPDPVSPGSQLTYTIAAWNLASSAAAFPNTTVTATYDPKVTFVSADPPPRPGTDNVWDLGSLPFEDPQVIEITVQLDAGLAPPFFAELMVVLASDGSDDVFASVFTDIHFPAHLAAIARGSTGW